MPHVLIVPPGDSALVELAHVTDNPSLLNERGQGTYGILTYVVNGTTVEIEYLANDGAPINPRARLALVAIGGPHVVFTGTVLFTGLTEEMIVDMLKATA